MVDVVRAPNKYLLDLRFYRQRRRSYSFRVGGYFAVNKDLQAELFGGAAKNVAALFLQYNVFWEEQHAYAILSIRRKVNAQSNAFVEEVFMGHLYGNASAITGIVFATTSAPVLHIFQYGERIGNYCVGFIAFDVYDKANATGIMLKGRGVKSTIGCHHSKLFLRFGIIASN